MYFSVKSNAMELIDDPNVTEKDIHSYFKYFFCDLWQPEAHLFRKTIMICFG